MMKKTGGIAAGGSPWLRTLAAAFALAGPAAGCASQQPKIVYVQPPDRGDCILPVLKDHKETEPYKFHVDDKCLEQKKQEQAQKERARRHDEAVEFAAQIASLRTEVKMPDGKVVTFLDKAKIGAVLGIAAAASPETQESMNEALAPLGFSLPQLFAAYRGGVCQTFRREEKTADGTRVVKLSCRTEEEEDEDLPDARNTAALSAAAAAKAAAASAPKPAVKTPARKK